MKIELRRGRLEDAPGLARVSVDSWRVAYRDLLPPAYLDRLSYADREQRWQERLASDEGERWVLLVDGQVAGFVSLASTGSPEIGELDGIYLHPDFFGQGLGRRLMELALERLRQQGHGEAVLWVLDGNRRAERFYEVGGWQREDLLRPHPHLGAPVRRYRRTLVE